MKSTTLILGALLVCAPAFGQSDTGLELDLSDTPTTTPPPGAKPAPATAKPAAAAPAKAAPAPAAAAPAPAAPAATPAPAKAAEADVGLDLSSTADVKAVLVTPPIVKITTSQSGAFTGFSAAKTTEKFDAVAHKRLVDAFQKQLDGKAIPAEQAFNLVSKEATPVSIRTPAGITKLAEASHVGWVLTFDLSKTGTLVGTIFDPTGAQKGEPTSVNGATGIPQKSADDIAAVMAKQLIELNKPKAAPVVAATPPPPEAPVQAPPEDDVRDAELEKSLAGAEKVELPPKIFVAVGPGAAIRSLGITGADADKLAELRNNPVVGLAAYAQIQPLQFFRKTAGKRWSDFEIDLNYRHAFVKAEGIRGGVQGQTCSMTDDDLQVRGTWRYKVVDHAYGPLVGVGGGWTQEQTVFSCSIPLLSTTYNGIDAQLRIKQPLFRELVALDLAFGPRFLLTGNGTTAKNTSLAGEAWIEARPISLFFARAGMRASRLTLSSATLDAVDTRLFFGAELGAFF